MLVTQGLGPSSGMVTQGLGPFVAVIIEIPGPEPSHGGYTGKRKKRKQEYTVVARSFFIKDRSPPSIRESDLYVEKETKFEIDGDVYEVKEGKWPTVKEAIGALPEEKFERIIEAARKELGVTRKQAEKAIAKRAAKEVRAYKAFQEELVDDDEEFWILLLMSEV